LSTDNLFLLFSFRRPQCLSASVLRTELLLPLFCFRFNEPFKSAVVTVRGPDWFENKLPGNPRVSLTSCPRKPVTYQGSVVDPQNINLELGNNFTTMASTIPGKFCSCVNAITTPNLCFCCCPDRRERVTVTAIWWSRRRQHAIL